MSIQLDNSIIFIYTRYKGNWNQMIELICKIGKDMNMFSICDIVLNHIAKESAWIKEHPDCSYNCHNSPHLRPAFLLDRMIYQVHISLIILFLSLSPKKFLSKIPPENSQTIQKKRKSKKTQKNPKQFP